MQPKFSIITVIYNGQRFIHRSHRCLMAQSIRDWEWIVVDDGSRDGTATLLDELCRCEKRLRVFSYSQNRGRGFARTLALEKARGSWAVIWDVDDLYFPQRLERIDQASRQGYDYYCSTAVVLDQGLRFLGVRDWSFPFPPSTLRSGCHAAMAIRLDLAREVGYFSQLRTVGQIGEDVAIIYKLTALHGGLLDDEPMLINVIGNEVFLRKSIHVNTMRMRYLQHLFDAGHLPISAQEFHKLRQADQRKLRMLRCLRICPPLYRLIMSFRPRGQLIPNRALTAEQEKFIHEIRMTSSWPGDRRHIDHQHHQPRCIDRY